MGGRERARGCARGAGLEALGDRRAEACVVVKGALLGGRGELPELVGGGLAEAQGHARVGQDAVVLRVVRGRARACERTCRAGVLLAAEHARGGGTARARARPCWEARRQEDRDARELVVEAEGEVGQGVGVAAVGVREVLTDGHAPCEGRGQVGAAAVAALREDGELRGSGWGWWRPRGGQR